MTTVQGDAGFKTAIQARGMARESRFRDYFKARLGGRTKDAIIPLSLRDRNRVAQKLRKRPGMPTARCIRNMGTVDTLYSRDVG